jgi:hypothetical protein
MKLKSILTFFGWPLLILPACIMWTGMAMNEIAIHTNQGKMPVYFADCEKKMAPRPNPLEEFITGESTPETDPVHKCMTPNSHAKIFGDILVSDRSVVSIGDLLIEYSNEARWCCYALWITILGMCLIRKEKFYVE